VDRASDRWTVLFREVHQGGRERTDVFRRWIEEERPPDHVVANVEAWFEMCEATGPPSEAAMIHLGDGLFATPVGWGTGVYARLRVVADDRERLIYVTAIG
jgi:hypothetical protein